MTAISRLPLTWNNLFESPEPARVDVETKGLAVKKPTGMLEIHGQSN